MNKSPFATVNVYRWKSDSEKILYTFDESIGTIKENIYQDDTIESALNKIASFITKSDNVSFYAWINKSPLLFTIKQNKWKGYHLNPFKSQNHQSDSLNEPIEYIYNVNDLFTHNKINIVFAEDLPPLLQKNKYYFSDLKGQTYKYYKKHNDKLTSIKNIDSSTVKIMPEYYYRISLQHILQLNTILPDIFDKLHTSKHIDMIQWIDDSSKILYKLSKKHRIKNELLSSITNIDKIDKINVINIFSIITRNSFCKISIDDSKISFNYILDSRAYTTTSTITEHKKQLQAVLENSLKIPIKLNEISMNVRVRIEVVNSQFTQVVKKISENIDIFHIVKNTSSSKQSLTTIYKRSVNYSQSTDIYDYIKSRINIGISRVEIIEELSNLGVSGDLETMIRDVLDMMLQEADVGDKPVDNQLKLLDNGTVVIIQPYSQGYDVSITNCANTTEMHNLLFWLSKIIATTISKKPLKQVKIPSPIKQKTPSVSSSDYDSLDDELNNLQIDGGFPAKNTKATKTGKSKKNNYLITMLQQADKELFGENYARDKCQNASQPVVFSKEHKEMLEKNNQLIFDNIVEYGSSKDNTNFYACPRLWCPTSKVPLSVDDKNSKCPIEGEEPMMMIWDNDITKKRYVKLIKPNDKGMCAPCCGKKQPDVSKTNECMGFLKDHTTPIKENKTNLKTKSPQQKLENDKETKENDNYIMNQPAPIPDGRFGTIPASLHKILFYDKDIKHDSCLNFLNKTHSCFVRKGINNNRNDSCILAISDLLGIGSKKDFVKKIKNNLDLVTFISLDNGNICLQFMSMREIIPEDNQDLIKRFNMFKKNTSLCNLPTNSNVSRLLNIYLAYTKYIEYIASDDFTAEKNPEFLYSLVNILFNINIIVCEKITKTNEIFFNCPAQSEINSDLNPLIGIILKEGKYYEPVELKMRRTPSVKLFKMNDYPKLKDIISQCSSGKDKDSITMFNNIYVLNNWLNTGQLKNSKKFAIQHVIINDDLTIDKFLTMGNILIRFKKISISFLPVLLKNFNLSNNNIIFYSDIIGREYNINILKDDLHMFLNKCKNLDVIVIIGQLSGLNNDNMNELYSTLKITPEQYPNSLILHTNNYNEFYKNIAEDKLKSNTFFNLQKMVVQTILQKYSDEQLASINTLDRKTKINTLKELFKDHNGKRNAKNIQWIIEEIPIDSRKSLKKWLSSSIIHTKYNFLSSKVDDMRNKGEYVFSQNALIKNGAKNIPDYLIAHHEALPNTRNVTEESKYINVNIDEVHVDNLGTLPSIFTGTYEKLPGKWRIHAKSKLSDMVYVKGTYGRKTIPDFTEWLAKIVGMHNVTYDNVVSATNQKFFDILNNKDAMIELLQDLSMFHSWLQAVNKTVSTVQVFWDSIYSKLSSDARFEYMKKILDKDSFYPNDLHILSISELLNLSIIVIQRGKYGKFDSSDNRGGNADLVVSSSFFPASHNMESRPVIILNKISDKKGMYSAYHIVVDKNAPQNIYLKYNDTPDYIKTLISAHLGK